MGTTKKWRDLLCGLPKYDPFRSSGDSWFDPKAAQDAIDFFPECIRHVEGALANEPFKLERWQRSIIANIFGWKRKDRHGRVVRRYRKAFLYVPRKNGKTPFAAALALYVFFCDDEKGQQNYMAAAEREQAGFLFRQSKGMVEAEPELKSRCKIYGGNAAAGQSRSIVRESDGSFLKVISADAHTKHGGNAHLVLIDELHAQPNRDLYDVLATSMASQNRKQPLMVLITTADFLRESICNEQYDYASKVRDGVIEDAAYLPIIYEALPGEDWTDPKVWEKANPNLGVSVSLEYLEAECRTAKETPGYENTFRRLHLNMRTEQDVRWLSLEAWEANATPLPPQEELLGRDCFAGLDLANTADVAAFVLVFPPRDAVEPWYVLPRFWVPAAACLLRERKNKTRFDDWVRRGFMDQTPGDVIDFSFIEAAILEANRLYRINKLEYDKWNASDLVCRLVNQGVACEEFTQCLTNYNEPCKKLEDLLTERKLAHGGNPVLQWMATNVAIHTDGRGYKMPSRKASTEKIDGIAAMLMALGPAIRTPVLGSVYDTRGVEELGGEESTEPEKGDTPRNDWWSRVWADDDDDE